MANCQPDIATHNATGSTQTSRLLHALKTDSIKVDERTIEDLIIATNTLSEHLNYYNPNNVLLGNWSTFFQWETTAVLAQIAHLDTAQYLEDLKLKKRALLFESNADERRKIIVDFFKGVVNSFKNIEAKINHISNEIQFKEYLKATAPTINSLLTTIIERLETPTKKEDQDDVRYTLQHHLFNKKIQNLFGLLNDWKQKSSIQLQENLNSYASHTPQYALYLAFLKLFGIAQEDLNHFTQRHLDFYYKKILHLTSEAAKPDAVHVCIEPYKNEAPFLLEKDNVFVAGKDAEGKNKYYKPIADTAINQAKITNLYGATLGTNDAYYFEDITDRNASGENFKAFPQTNIATQLGLAIASPLFFLRGGTRTITLTFNGTSNKINKDDYEFFLTGEEEWLSLETVQIRNSTIEFTISADEKAIVPFDPELHEGTNLNTEFPVLKITTKNGVLHKTFFNSIKIKVKVAGYKQFRLFSDLGEIDHTKSFQPFGAIPKKGNSFIFSCNEFFQKKNAKGKFNIETDGNTWYASGKTKIALLNNGKWENKGNWNPNEKAFNIVNTNSVVSSKKTKSTLLENKKLSIRKVGNFQKSFNTNQAKSNFNQTKFSVIKNNVLSYDFSENPLFSSKHSNGFAKIIFNDNNYRKEKYLEDYITAAKSIEPLTPITTPPEETLSTETFTPELPYIPTITAISFDYEVTDTVTLGTAVGSDENIFTSHHLYPNGYKELTASTRTILPEIDHKGEFYIGIENVLPGNVLNLLIQVAEGTANPRQHIVNLEWYYLQANEWQRIENHQIIEETNNLTQSGIVQYTVSKTVVLDQQTKLPAGIFWIKVVVPNEEHYVLDAVCDILGVHAQALKATLFDFENTGVAFTENTAAETIAKLYQPKNQIKAITQPYASFGGKIKETDALFYQRVSERLRHKDRAITIWDYEKLILDNFPEVFRVKCLNHFRYDRRESEHLGEIANTGAGYVTIIPVAKARAKQTNISWKPLVDLGTMARIKMFLEAKTSPHVRINVKPPQLEKLELRFQVTYRDLPGGDEIIYKQQLQDVINTYLSPWAYHTTAEVTFQSEIEKSELIQLIEKQSFVDNVSDFVVKHHTLQEDSDAINTTKIVANKVIPTTPYSLFIPHEHTILTDNPCCS